MSATVKGPYNYIAGTGISVGVVLNSSTGQFDVTVTNTAPSSGSTVTSVGAGTGISVTGTSTAPIVNVAASGVTAGAYGDSSHYATVTVDATGRVTSASQVALPSGPGFAWVTAGGSFEAFGTVLGGDVSQGTHSLGSQPLTVVGLKGASLPALPGSDQYLHYTGSAWAFSTLPAAGAVVATGYNVGTSGSVSASSTGSSLASTSVTVASGQHVDVDAEIGISWVNIGSPAADQVDVSLVIREDGVSIRTGRFVFAPVAVGSTGCIFVAKCSVRSSPSAASHTYTIDLVNNNTSLTVNYDHPAVRAYVVT